MDIKTNYLNKITELTQELNHYVEQYNIIQKRKRIEENNTVNIKKKEKEKSWQKRK